MTSSLTATHHELAVRREGRPPKGLRTRRRRRSHNSRRQLVTSVGVRQIPGWPLAIRFLGRENGREEVWWFGRMREGRIAVPLGSLTHGILMGVPPLGLPETLWKPPSDPSAFHSVLTAWPWVSKQRSNRDRPSIEYAENTRRLLLMEAVLETAPMDRIQKRPVVMLENISLETLRALRVEVGKAQQGLTRHPSEDSRWCQAFSEYVRYRERHSRVEDVWYARDIEAAAWCEIIHARQNRATTRTCAVCGVLFLRPRALYTEKCPTCRALNWRQLKKVLAVPQGQRQSRAIEAYRQTIAEKAVADELPRLEWPSKPSTAFAQLAQVMWGR